MVTVTLQGATDNYEQLQTMPERFRGSLPPGAL